MLANVLLFQETHFVLFAGKQDHAAISLFFFNLGRFCFRIDNKDAGASSGVDDFEAVTAFALDLTCEFVVDRKVSCLNENAKF